MSNTFPEVMVFVCHFCSSCAMYSSQSGYQRRLIITRSGRKIKGRGQRVRPPHFLQEFSPIFINSYTDSLCVLLPTSGIGLRRGLVRGPGTAIAAAKPHHAGVRKYAVRE